MSVWTPAKGNFGRNSQKLGRLKGTNELFIECAKSRGEKKIVPSPVKVDGEKKR